jgi:hypothetical protein
MQYCARTSLAESDAKLVTRLCSVLMTKSRLQHAFGCGLSVAGWTFDDWPRAQLICEYSLEPEKVMTLLRAHGVPWSHSLCDGAAHCNNLALLQWLHSQSCPLRNDTVLLYASRSGSVAMLEWLLTVTGPWSTDEQQLMFHDAACMNELAVVQWLRARGAVWPEVFYDVIDHVDGVQSSSWHVTAVQWAIASGSGWLDWHCVDYAAEMYETAVYKQQATELLEWAHANGCPCTCEQTESQQQQQEQQQQQQ